MTDRVDSAAVPPTTPSAPPGAETVPAPWVTGHEPPSDPVCSARGCTAPAEVGLRWNNPGLHTPERRKTWLACPEHREHLSTFLGVRGFLREVLPVAELPTA